MLVDAVGNKELGVLGPVVIPLGEPNLLLAQGLAVRGACILLVGRAPANVAVDDDQGRPFALLAESVKARSSISRSLASPTRVTFQP